MSSPRTLVAGVGNIFLGDDGFGCEVARRLAAARSLPDGVKVEDFGIRGLHLAYELLDGYDVLILVDTMGRNEDPGTLTVMEVDPNVEGGVAPDAHDMDPATMLALLTDMGGKVGRVLVVGCEPAEVGEGIGLSDPVAAAVEEAMGVVHELVVEVQAVETSAFAGKES